MGLVERFRVVLESWMGVQRVRGLMGAVCQGRRDSRVWRRKEEEGWSKEFLAELHIEYPRGGQNAPCEIKIVPSTLDQCKPAQQLTGPSCRNNAIWTVLIHSAASRAMKSTSSSSLLADMTVRHTHLFSNARYPPSLCRETPSNPPAIPQRWHAFKHVRHFHIAHKQDARIFLPAY